MQKESNSPEFMTGAIEALEMKKNRIKTKLNNLDLSRKKNKKEKK